MTKYGTNTYTYTLNGELKTKGNPEGVTVYDHDPMGNLVQVILPNSTVIGYTYDAKNRRVAKMVNGFITERLIYKNQLAPIAKVDANGNILEEYVYGTGVNSPDYIRKDGVNYRVIKDLLGSVRMIDNASTGEIVKEIEYDEFGNIVTETGTYSIPFGFAGGLQDRDTGLIHFGARWYDPEVGRWIKKDPIMFDGGLNHYAYVSNDPVNKIDPTGLAEIYFLMNFDYRNPDHVDFFNDEFFNIQRMAEDLKGEGYTVSINYLTSYENILEAFSDDEALMIYSTGHGYKDAPVIWPAKGINDMINPWSFSKIGRNLQTVILNHCHQGSKSNKELWENQLSGVEFVSRPDVTFSSESNLFLNELFSSYVNKLRKPQRSGTGYINEINSPK